MKPSRTMRFAAGRHTRRRCMDHGARPGRRGDRRSASHPGQRRRRCAANGSTNVCGRRFQHADAQRPPPSLPLPPLAAPPASGMVASLPSGCEAAGDLFRCGNVYYRPCMQGTTVVYAKVSGQ